MMPSAALIRFNRMCCTHFTSLDDLWLQHCNKCARNSHLHCISWHKQIQQEFSVYMHPLIPWGPWHSRSMHILTWCYRFESVMLRFLNDYHLVYYMCGEVDVGNLYSAYSKRVEYACWLAACLTSQLVYIQHWPGEHFKKTDELIDLRALKLSPVNKRHIFHCKGKKFWVEFQRVPLKFHAKYLTHTLKDIIFIECWNFKSSCI